jgi:magnesium transporter
MNWHDVRDPNDPELDRLAAQYQLHSLHIEDCRHRGQRAKMEDSDGYLFLVLKPIVRKADGTLDISDLDVFLGRDFLITVDEGDSGEVGGALDRIRTAWPQARGDQLLYRIMDAMVDSYTPALDRFSDEIDELQDRVLDQPTPQTLESIFGAKRALVEMRRVLGNTRDVAAQLQRFEGELIGRDMWPFLRDVFDHVARDLDLVETQRDLLSGALDIYLSSVANRTNQVVKVLTVLGTAALPAVVIASMYGMNVEGLPWKSAPHAFALITGVIVVITAGLLWLLRAMRWF